MEYPLEPGRAEMTAYGRAAVEFVARFTEGLAAAPGTGVTADPGLRELLLRPPGDGPSDFASLLDTFGAAAGKAVETAGPGYLAYIPGGGLFVSALAEFLARSVNRYTGLAGLAPELVALEQGVLRWLCGEFGLPASAGGLITTGGSMATLAAVVAARQHQLGEDFQAGTIYLTEHSHHCIAKAARIAGLAADPAFEVPWEPTLSTVAFRLRDGGDDASLALLDRVNRAGRVFLSSTRIGGRVMLRLCILSHRTHREHVAEALALIRAGARR